MRTNGPTLKEALKRVEANYFDISNGNTRKHRIACLLNMLKILTNLSNEIVEDLKDANISSYSR